MSLLPLGPAAAMIGSEEDDEEDQEEEEEDTRSSEEMLGRFEPAVTSLKVGDRVQHDHFGKGTIEALQGAGVNARASVRFPAHGVKHLLLQYAKLTKLG